MLSIIIPVYNVENFLVECIESVLNQDYTNIEVILVNDGSTDDSAKICKEYTIKDLRVKYFEKKNGGLSSARNYGVEKSNGEYIVFLDSDDFWLKNKLKNMMDIIYKDNLDMMMFKAYSYYSSNNSYTPFSKDYNIEKTNLAGTELLEEILSIDYDFGWCAIWYIVKKNLLIENKIEFLEGYYCEDVNYTFKLWNIVNKVGYYNEYVYAYRRENENSITHLASFDFCKDLLYMIKKNIEICNENNLNENLKNLIFLNAQTLVRVVLFWYMKYSKAEREILKLKIKDLFIIYDFRRKSKNKGKFNDRITRFLLKTLGINLTGVFWCIKNKVKKNF